MVFGKNANAWRNHPFLRPRGLACLPGFAYAVGIYGAYVMARTALGSSSDSGHGHGHHGGHSHNHDGHSHGNDHGHGEESHSH